MIESGMPAVRASMRVMDMELVAAPVSVVTRLKPFFAVDRIGRLLVIVSLVILLFPAILLVSVVAILVPCFFRIPVCGPSLPSIRTPAGK